MTRKELAQLLREAQHRRIDALTTEQVLQEFNTCRDCLGQILSPAQLAVIIAEAESLEEFYELFAEAREADEDGREWN
jgi:hypothetical protein